MDKIHFVAGPLEPAEDAVDSVSGITVNARDAPLQETLNETIAAGLVHEFPFS